VPLEVPRDRLGTFEPSLIGSHERLIADFDDRIIPVYTCA
jgi:putative transposase